MAIAAACRKCGARMEFQDADAGRAGQCPSCQADILVPRQLKLCVGCRRQVAAEVTSCPACGTALAPGALAVPLPAAPVLTPAAVPVEEQVTSGKAVTSLVLGLCSLILMCLTGVPAIVLGALALGDIRRGAGRVRGQGLATSGIVLGSVGSVFSLCLPVLVALLLPAVQMAREAARRTQCRNNLRMIGVALHAYHDEWGSFPPAYTVNASGQPLLSWRVLILPYLGEQTLYDKFRLDEAWDSEHNSSLADLMPSVFSCPSDPNVFPNATGYVAITGPGTAFPPNRAVKLPEIVDGTASTVFIGELRSSTITWTQPDDILASQIVASGGLPSFHPGGVQVLFGDGSVRFLSNTTSGAQWSAYTTIAGGEAVSIP